MPIDSAEKRRSIGGIPFLPLGVNVTPTAAKDQEWRQQVSWSYSGILAGGAAEPSLTIDLVVPLPVWPWSQVTAYEFAPTEGVNTLDAANEYVDFIGQVYWEGEAASKVLSSAGGTIISRFGAATFANGGTNLRIGIQDVDTTTGPPARGDGTHDVQANLVGGTDTITASTLRETAMESGSKTITFGQLIAIRFELTARAGADTMSVSGMVFATEPVYPHVTHNSGTVNIVPQTLPNVLLKADDGTIGWLMGSTLVETWTLHEFDNADTPDEMGSIIEFPFEVAVVGMVFYGRIGFLAGGNTRAILYSDPLGSPAVQRSKDIDTNQVNVIGTSGYGAVSVLFDTPYTVTADTPFALTMQPQDANGATFMQEFDMGSAITGRMTPYQSLGGTWSKGTRTNASGALTSDPDSVIICGPLLSQMAVSGGETPPAETVVFVGTNYAQIFPDRGMVKSGAQ